MLRGRPFVLWAKGCSFGTQRSMKWTIPLAFSGLLLGCGGPGPEAADPLHRQDLLLTIHLDLSSLDWGFPEITKLKEPLADVWPAELSFVRAWLEPLVQENLYAPGFRRFLTQAEPAFEALRRPSFEGPLRFDGAFAQWTPATPSSPLGCPEPRRVPWAQIRGQAVEEGEKLHFGWSTPLSVQLWLQDELDRLARCAGFPDRFALIEGSTQCGALRAQLSEPALRELVGTLCDAIRGQVARTLDPPGLEAGTEVIGWEFVGSADGPEVHELRLTTESGRPIFGEAVLGSL